MRTLAALGAAGRRVAVITGATPARCCELGGFGRPRRAAGPRPLRRRVVVPGIDWHDPRGPAVIERLRAPPSRGGRRATEDRGGCGSRTSGLSLVVHARKAADPAAELRRSREPVAALAAELGLETHDGRGVIEVRLPGFDKGVALAQLVGQIQPTALLFAGDDIGDLPGFEVVRDSRPQAGPPWGIAVRSPERVLGRRRR